MVKKVLVILDGASDLPCPSLGNKTPLETSHMPNLDSFVKNGRIGYMYPINEEVVPGSDNSLISIFGNDPNLCKRGVYEAIGAGIGLKNGDLALRANFGTIENLKNRRVIDRRAGRTLTTSEAKILSKDLNEKVKLPCEFIFKNTVQHRGVLVLRGKFSSNISNTDPEWSSDNKNYEFNFSKTLDETDKTKESARIVNEFVSQAFTVLNNHPINLARIKRGLLPANIIFLRGAGSEIPKIKQYKNWMSINSMPLEIGISKISKMKVFSFEYPELKNMDSYRNLYEGLYKTIDFAIKIIKRENNNFSGCYIQFKETDIPGHDNKPHEKRRMLEIIDKEFFSFLRKFLSGRDVGLVVTCDHSTPCKLKAHSADPVPVLVSDSVGYDCGKTSSILFSRAHQIQNPNLQGFGDGGLHFCESEARKGSLGKIYGNEFMEKTGLGK